MKRYKTNIFVSLTISSTFDINNNKTTLNLGDILSVTTSNGQTLIVKDSQNEKKCSYKVKFFIILFLRYCSAEIFMINTVDRLK